MGKRAGVLKGWYSTLHTQWGGGAVLHVAAGKQTRELDGAEIAGRHAQHIVKGRHT